MRHSIRKHRKINRLTKKRRGVSNIKYKCVRLRSRTRKHRKIGGAGAPTGPMVLDPKTNVMYSCTAMPT